MGWLCVKIGSLIAGIPLACAVGLFFSWWQDDLTLWQQGRAITENLDTDSARIRAVNDWVYHNKGFAKNDRYFIVPALGPTPIQVMEQGGDCSDKSRLVAAMLNSLGINAGLVMISSCSHCGFIHTVVEAQYEAGRMVVDPTWGFDYATPDGKFLGVADLKGTNRGQERILALQNQRAATDKIAYIPLAEVTFDHAVAINWDRNAATRTVATTLRFMGYEPATLFRPRLLEDPKLSITIFLIGAVTIIVSASFLIDLGGRSVKMRIRRRIASLDADVIGT